MFSAVLLNEHSWNADKPDKLLNKIKPNMLVFHKETMFSTNYLCGSTSVKLLIFILIWKGEAEIQFNFKLNHIFSKL